LELAPDVLDVGLGGALGDGVGDAHSTTDAGDKLFAGANRGETLEALLYALDASAERRPGVLVVTEESFIQRRAFRILKGHAETRRPKRKAHQLGLFLDQPTLFGPTTELPTTPTTELPPPPSSAPPSAPAPPGEPPQ